MLQTTVSIFDLSGLSGAACEMAILSVFNAVIRSRRLSTSDNGGFASIRTKALPMAGPTSLIQPNLKLRKINPRPMITTDPNHPRYQVTALFSPMINRSMCMVLSTSDLSSPALAYQLVWFQTRLGDVRVPVEPEFPLSTSRPLHNIHLTATECNFQLRLHASALPGTEPHFRAPSGTQGRRWQRRSSRAPRLQRGVPGLGGQEQRAAWV